MQIRNFLKESFIDYPGKISSVVFVSGCNYRCPSCHVRSIVDGKAEINEENFFEYIDSRKGWIEGVVLCGGEPTAQNGIGDFASRIKESGLKVKLDTNGSNPEMLDELRREEVIDYVAMDIKAPPRFYSRAVGKKIVFEDMERSMVITSSFPDYEFRTTICPIYKNGSVAEFMNAQEIEEIANYIIGITIRNDHKYFLQRFIPRKNELIDLRLEDFPETSEILMKEAYEKVSKILPKTRIRG